MQNNMSIDDILQSVQNVIDEKENILKDTSPYEELQLIEVAKDCNKELPEKIVEKGEKIINAFDQKKEVIKTKQSLSNEIVKPQIKEWLDANLPNIVKQIVSEEVKKTLANVNKDSK